MPKITFLGAGSTIFVKNIIGDSFMCESLCESHIALYDIDGKRLEESRQLIEQLNKNINSSRAVISTHLGEAQRRDAIKGSDYIINAVQIGGYDPSTIIDFEVPKKFGLRQTIGDTLGIGGIFRGLRTVPVLLEIANEIEELAPDAWFLNYTNPMSIITGAMLRATDVKTVGLCHSVQTCAADLLKALDISYDAENLKWRIGGINHMAWLLELKDGDKDIYPEVKKRAALKNVQARADSAKRHDDMIRYEIMKHFGYYITESSEHNAEYTPYWIKNSLPGLISEFNIPLDEYPRRCVEQISKWESLRDEINGNVSISHERSKEYGSYIMDSIESDKPYRFHGNILNKNFITNLPENSCVEVPCLVDRNGIAGTHFGSLPPQCAALNMTNINVHEMTIQAVLTGRRDYIYQAAFLDPHTSSEMTLDRIKEMCDELITAHGNMMPVFK